MRKLRVLSGVGVVAEDATGGDSVPYAGVVGPVVGACFFWFGFGDEVRRIECGVGVWVFVVGNVVDGVSGEIMAESAGLAAGLLG